MKRISISSESSDFSDDITTLRLVNSLMLLSTRGGGGGDHSSRVFECKTCSRQFSSFQALGGHRASHKKPRLAAAGDHDHPPPSPAKPKAHECSVCGLEFAIGQALGGHMRRHRSTPGTGIEDRKSISGGGGGGRRVMWLDLNLTPLENKFMFGNVSAPARG